MMNDLRGCRGRFSYYGMDNSKKRFKFFLNLPELKELLMFYQMNQKLGF